MLQTNDQINTKILLKNSNGEDVSIKDYLNSKYTVLYIYPKDDTEGCTKEACSFRDFNNDIKKLGVEIIGISKDGVKSHNKFKKKYELNFELLSDETTEFMQSLGVWAEKSMYGRKYMGALRTTFILDKKGVILHVFEKVKPEEHAKEVYDFLKTL